MMLILSAWLGGAPEAALPAYSRDDLDKLIQIADAEWQRLEGRCASEESGAKRADADPQAGEFLPVARAGVDREAELAYMRMAEMRRLAAQHYPYGKLGKEGQEIHSDDIHQAAQLYERAYACNPGWDSRRYLNEAIDMVVQRRREIREGERRAEGAPDNVQLMDDEARLRAKLAELRAPACKSPAPACPTASQGVVSSEPARGYRKRFMDLFALRVEFGGVFTADLYEGIMDDGVADDRTSPVAFTFALAPGVRLLAGSKQRHVFGLGFRYTFVSFEEEKVRDRASQMAARFEYGVRASLKWFSLHVSFEPGIQVHPEPEYFGHAQIGGAGTLCTWNEALCLRLGGSKSLRTERAERRAGEPYFDIGSLTFGIDVFRMTDNLLRATEGDP